MTIRRLAIAAVTVLAACGQTPSPDACQLGEVRCKGVEVEQCVRLPSGAADWGFSEACLGECSSGACSAGGSCGCFGDASGLCGGPESPPIVLRTALPAGTRVPCDGESRVLVHSDRIRSAAGATLPDGTLVTFTDGGRDLITSADADPETPGVQRPTLRGEAMVTVRAPASCAAPESVTVTATGLGRCAGAGTVELEPAPAASSETRPVYVVEDFTTTHALDRGATTATWDASRGAAVSLPFADFGDGRDGDLVVDGSNSSAEAPYDLATTFAKTFNVIAIGPGDVLTDCGVPGVAPGDHVLLYTVWGQLPGTTTESAAIGTYELKKVESARANIIVFTEPVRRVFGHRSNGDLTGHRVVVQRVPQFASVTVASDGYLSSAGLTTDMRPANPALHTAGGSGVLAFRVKGRLSVAGVITMDHKGFPVGVRHDVGTDPELARIRLGNAGAEEAGGGGLFVTASTLSFRHGDAFAPVTSAIRANSNDGEGGMVWAMAGVMETNDTTPTIRYRAMGPHLKGRVCLDFARLDQAPASIVDSGGDLLIGQGGAFRVASHVLYGTPAVEIRSAAVLGVHGWPTALAAGEAAANTLVVPSSAAPLSSLLPGFVLATSADDGATWASAESGLVPFAGGASAAAGGRFKWRMDLANLDDRPMFLRALAFKLEVAAR